MRTPTRLSGLLLGLLMGLLSAATAHAASITVNPSTVAVGGTVTVTGDVLDSTGQPGCQVPGTVILLSGAFAGQGSFMNQDVEANVGADGKFSAQATILAGVSPGTYPITGRCGGGNLGVQATLVVTSAGLPSTGSGGLFNARASGRQAQFALASVLILASISALLVGGWLRSPRRR